MVTRSKRPARAPAAISPAIPAPITTACVPSADATHGWNRGLSRDCQLGLARARSSSISRAVGISKPLGSSLEMAISILLGVLTAGSRKPLKETPRVAQAQRGAHNGRGAMEFRMLGPLEVRRGEETLALGGAKQRALFAILLLHANHVVSRERLAELLWGDEPPSTADHVIEVYVSQLRRVLEPEGAPFKLLVRKAAGYLLQVPPSDIDVNQFAGLVDGARS